MKQTAFHIDSSARYLWGFNNTIVEFDPEIESTDYLNHFASQKLLPVFLAGKTLNRKIQVYSEIEIKLSDFLQTLSIFADVELVLCKKQIKPDSIGLILSQHEIAQEIPGQYLYFGESSEGLFIGPVLTTEEVLDFTRFQNNWAYSQTLSNLGFESNQRPLSLTWYLEKYPNEMAETVLAILANSPDSSYLLEKGEFKRIWKQQMLGKISMQELISTYTWDRGLIRPLGPCVKKDGIFIHSTKVQILGTDYHESCSGKGHTEEQASFLSVAESIERYSAFLANNLLTYADMKTECLFLSNFPNKRTADFDYDYVQAHKLKDESQINIPASLVAFPNIHPDKKAIGSTAGLAFHTNLDLALLSAIDEIFEKDNLYTNFLKQVRPYRIPVDIEGPFVFIHFKNELNLPIVHCFYLGQNFICRGSANDSNLNKSIEKAYEECVQCGSNYENTDAAIEACSSGEAFLNWRKPEVMQEIKVYLESARPMDFEVLNFKTKIEKIKLYKVQFI